MMIQTAFTRRCPRRLIVLPPENKKGPPALSVPRCRGEGGSPFFRVAMRAVVKYKESRGYPLFPFQARGLKL